MLVGRWGVWGGPEDRDRGSNPIAGGRGAAGRARRMADKVGEWRARGRGRGGDGEQGRHLQGEGESKTGGEVEGRRRDGVVDVGTEGVLGGDSRKRMQDGPRDEERAVAIAVSGTSWTVDEDMGMLLDALVGYDALACGDARLVSACVM